MGNNMDTGGATSGIADRLGRAVFEQSPVGMLVCNGQGAIVEFNSQCEAIFGYPREEVLGQPVEMLVPRSAREAHVRLRSDLASQNGKRPMGHGRDLHGRHKNGGTIPLEIGLHHIEQDGVGQTLVTLVDISERKRGEENMARMAEELREASSELQTISAVDPLTRVLNRQGLEQVLWREVQRPTRTGAQLMCILLDLDDFRGLNDSLGYAVGDRLLESIAREFKKTVRPIDFVARVGGDEFLVLLPDTRAAEARHVAERLRLAVASATIPLYDGERRLTVSVGVSAVPSGLSSSEELLKMVQTSLRRSKADGKNRVSSDDPLSEQEDRMTTEEVLAQLLDGKGIVAAAQPIVELPSAQVIGFEMLSRCTFPPYTQPNDFFSLARESNTLTGIDLQCVRACMDAALRLSGAADVHVNVFPSTLLATPGDRLIDLLQLEGSTTRVCVELSEQQFVGDPSFLGPAIAALRSEGIGVAIDDVGFGRSSLETLILLEPDIVKIDRRYVHGCSRSLDRRRALTRLAQVIETLGAKGVAEGVESVEDSEVVSQLGIHGGQGYLWGKPKLIEA